MIPAFLKTDMEKKNMNKNRKYKKAIAAAMALTLGAATLFPAADSTVVPLMIRPASSTRDGPCEADDEPSQRGAHPDTFGSIPAPKDFHGRISEDSSDPADTVPVLSRPPAPFRHGSAVRLRRPIPPDPP